jgi:hypothetical protein
MVFCMTRAEFKQHGLCKRDTPSEVHTSLPNAFCAAGNLRRYCRKQKSERGPHNQLS